jgi:hypothetical protein
MDSETLTYLLRGGHIDMPDRVARGLWPHPPLKFEEVLALLTELLEEHEWFPRETHAHREGESVDERGAIQRVSSGRYVYRLSRAHPSEPLVLAQTAEHVFPSARAAAGYFLKWDLNLPGDLDGWKVVE